jgi:integrase
MIPMFAIMPTGSGSFGICSDVCANLSVPFAAQFAAGLGLDRGYSAHSMRATFITTALENGAQLEDVQEAAGHRDPGTTKLYDRRGYNPEKAASFFATY